jgi:hypothetical protein
LLKKAHLPRWPARTLVAAYQKYASLGLSHAALHLDLLSNLTGERLFSILFG